jgi:hypothetical protein
MILQVGSVRAIPSKHAPMVFLDDGVGDRASIGVRVGQQDLLARRSLEGRIDGRAFSQLICNQRRPRPKPGAVTAAKRWSERFLCVSTLGRCEDLLYVLKAGPARLSSATESPLAGLGGRG